MTATASSGLTASLAIVSGPATLLSGQVTATDTGTIVVRATQAGNAYYHAAPDTNWYISVTNGPTLVAGRWIFYNHSAWDGNNAAANIADDAAIATDKSALLPGAVAAFASYTSYSRGINGIMVDLQYFDGAAVHHTARPISATDFQFKVGNDNTPENWLSAPSPISVTVRSGAGVGGSDRVTIIWPDNAVQKQWLAVKVLATANTGLAAPDIFYFGNAIGDTGNSAVDAIVSVLDENAIRANPRNFLNPAPITSVWDINRDKLVSAVDEGIARGNVNTILSALQLIDLRSGATGLFAGTTAARDSSPASARYETAIAQSSNETLLIEGLANPGETLELWISRNLDSGTWQRVATSYLRPTVGRLQGWELPIPTDQSAQFFRVLPSKVGGTR